MAQWNPATAGNAAVMLDNHKTGAVWSISCESNSWRSWLIIIPDFRPQMVYTEQLPHKQCWRHAAGGMGNEITGTVMCGCFGNVWLLSLEMYDCFGNVKLLW